MLRVAYRPWTIGRRNWRAAPGMLGERSPSTSTSPDFFAGRVQSEVEVLAAQQPHDSLASSLAPQVAAKIKNQ